MNNPNSQRGALERVANYIKMRDEKPLNGIGGIVHSIHTGTKWAGELTLADLRQVVELAQQSGPADVAALQAKIDALMLEYCPEEMTPEQIANWAAHQVPAGPEAEAALDRAVKNVAPQVGNHKDGHSEPLPARASSSATDSDG